MNPVERSQIDAASHLLDAVVRLDVDPTLEDARWVACAVILDPLLEASNQGTCSAALAAGDARQLLCAVNRAVSQIAQIDTSGTRPA